MNQPCLEVEGGRGGTWGGADKRRLVGGGATDVRCVTASQEQRACLLPAHLLVATEAVGRTGGALALAQLQPDGLACGLICKVAVPAQCSIVTLRSIPGFNLR